MPTLRGHFVGEIDGEFTEADIAPPPPTPEPDPVPEPDPAPEPDPVQPDPEPLPELTGEALQARIDAYGHNGVSGMIHLPVGVIVLSEKLRSKTGVHLLGQGSVKTAWNGTTGRGGGTMFVPAPGYDGDGIVTEDFWHAGSMLNFGVRGFRGDGIAIRGGMGEASYIDGIFCGDNTGNGVALYKPSGTPVQIGRISCHSNGKAGLLLERQNHTCAQVQYVAGDDNGESLISIFDGNVGTNIQILAWKAEATTGHPDVILIRDLNGGIVTLGQGRVKTSADSPVFPGAIIRQIFVNGGPGLVSAMVTMDTEGAPYTYGYRDEKNNISVSQEDFLRKQFSNIPTLNV